ncbi:MAG: zf-TFIIB domain-containing protein [Dehalococcoidales bacterium]
MKCPNDSTEMHQVQITANYGLPLFLDQCPTCGGIWFDESELYRAKQGEAEKIDLLDTYILTTSTPVASPVHLCPQDGAQLSRFADPNFPAGIFVERCPSCRGFWLNRGEFTKFQHARQAMLPPKEPTAEDKKLQEQIQSILADQKNGDNESVLSKLNAFLSQPVGSADTLSLDANDNATEEANPVGAVMSVAMTLLRLFVFRG